MLDKFLGFGLGLRTQHFATAINDKPKVDWFEIISENCMVAGGKPRYYLEQIRADYPTTCKTLYRFQITQSWQK
jgi:uncharacterized protein (UPF0276 family)